MSIEFNTGEKLHALMGEVDKLLLSDFPHDASRDALKKLRQTFENHQKRLDRARRGGSGASTQSVCITINGRIHQYLPVLGFLFRATDVRNSFELYHLLQAYCRKLLGASSRLIISSEWEFSPLTYPMTVPELPEFVLVGLPSSESGNALVMSLAGHELGHSVWSQDALEQVYAPLVQEKVRKSIKEDWREFTVTFPEHRALPAPDDAQIEQNMFLSSVVEDISKITLSQIEEIYCDAIGSAAFGRSYAYAFHYLLAPDMGMQRAPEYPSLNTRAAYVSNFGQVGVEASLQTLHQDFSPAEPAGGKKDAYLLKIADAISDGLAEAIYMKARHRVSMTMPDMMPNDDLANRVRQCFQNNVPADCAASLADLLNAGWDHLIAENTKNFEAGGDSELVKWISELILKTAEVIEYRQQTA